MNDIHYYVGVWALVQLAWNAFLIASDPGAEMIVWTNMSVLAIGAIGLFVGFSPML